MFRSGCGNVSAAEHHSRKAEVTVNTRVGPRGQLAPRPLPGVLRPIIRFRLRMWSRFPKAPGYLYQVVERWGARLAVKPLECRLFNGMTMRCDLRDHIQRQIYFSGAFEP